MLGSASNASAEPALELLPLGEIGLELQALAFRRGDPRVQLLQPLDDDVLLVLERDGFRLLAIRLERALRFRQMPLEPLGFREQIRMRALRGVDLPLGAAGEIFAHERLRQLLRHRGALGLHADIDEARPFADDRP